MQAAQPQPIWVFAPGLLRVADVPQIAALAAPTPLLNIRPVAFGRKPLPGGQAEAEFGYTREAYALAGDTTKA